MSRRTCLASKKIMQATQIIGPFGGGPKKWQNRIQTMPNKAQSEEVMEVMNRLARNDQWAPNAAKLKRTVNAIFNRQRKH